MCENTFLYQPGLNFSLDRTCFFHETFPPSSPVPAVCSKAGDHSALGASFPCSPQRTSVVPLPSVLLEGGLGVLEGLRAAAVSCPASSVGATFLLLPLLSAPSAAASWGHCPAWSSPACLQSRMCCYGENFTLAGMSSFLICFVVGRGPRNQSVAELIYLPFPP